MAGFDIDFGALQQPNILGGYLQGQEIARKRRQDALDNQRQGEDDAMRREQFGMEREEFGLKKQKYADDQKSAEAERAKSALTETFSLTRGLQTPEQWEAAKANPTFRRTWDAIAKGLGQSGDIDTTTFDQVRQLNEIGARMSEKSPEEYTLGPGAARWKGDTKIAEQPFAPKAPDWRQRSKADGSTEWFDINAAGGGVTPSPAPIPNSGPDGLESITAMGARVTSGRRSPEDNRRVGGVPNSRHLTDQARDLVPPPGMTMAQLAERSRAAMPGAKVINEGDHVHVEWGGNVSSSSGGRSVPGDAPKASEWRADGKGMMFNRNGDKKPDPEFASSSGAATEGERTAGFLASRLADSLSNLTRVTATKPEAGKPSAWERALERVPFDGGASANLARSGERQEVMANQLDILDAALTLGTGAAYTREQLENYRSTYFPQLTDKPTTVTAKRQKLIALLKAAQIKAGRSAPPELKSALVAAERQLGADVQAKPAGAAPPAAIDYLRKNNTPQMRQAFEQKYGKGSAARMLGGGR